MAATLCNAIGDLSKGLCNMVGQICVAPCRLCSAVCEPINRGVKKACSSQFSLLIVTALALNVPPIIWSIKGAPYLPCEGSQWLLVNMSLCVINIAAAIYLAMTTKDISEAVNALLYDKFIAGYILICIGFFIWLCTGVSWSTQGRISGENCHEDISKLTSNSIWCGFFYFFVGGSALMLSLCFSWCKGGKKNKSMASSTELPPTTSVPAVAQKPEYVPPYVANTV